MNIESSETRRGLSQSVGGGAPEACVSADVVDAYGGSASGQNDGVPGLNAGPLIFRYGRVSLTGAAQQRRSSYPNRQALNLNGDVSWRNCEHTEENSHIDSFS